ncbi:hypothetical protein GIB67_024245 [Kingdonia uniflora]|uniref:Squalene monooxygenase n=1 Tax=Kingdonia uniflora TaxID=39325 RepID=A0A7J7LZV3_9MAGN|nr:hypothetical protein GIB67_024245 [Kingdonia uniflora]
MKCGFQVPPQLYDSFIVTIDKGSIKIIQNRSMPADPHPTPGALLMGDAFNMRHPLTGRGMTVALSDIVVPHNLLKPLRDLNDASSLCRHLKSFYTLHKVGVQTETELKEKKLRVEDVLNAITAAVEERIVVGGGYTLLRLAAENHKISQSDHLWRYGAQQLYFGDQFVPVMNPIAELDNDNDINIDLDGDDMEMEGIDGPLLEAVIGDESIGTLDRKPESAIDELGEELSLLDVGQNAHGVASDDVDESPESASNGGNGPRSGSGV